MTFLSLFKKETTPTQSTTGKLEYAPKQVLFNFNKKHLEDPTIPMWMLTFSGEQYYVDHVTCAIPWSTRERPDHSTKGTIILKNCLVTIDEVNCATITELTEHDKIRLKNREKGITRIIIPWASKTRVTEVLKNSKIKHGPLKTITGACTSTFYITDILDKKHMTMLTLSLDTKDFRILQENETYYKMYDDPRYKDHEEIDEDEYYWDSEDEETQDET